MSAGHGHEHHDHGGGHGHSHVPTEIKHERPLWIAFGLTLFFLLVEVAGGLLTNSLALLSDAAHMMTDVLALGISLFAVRMARRPADAKRTYGYARMEAIGALINGGLLFLAAGYILWAAVGRFSQPPHVESGGMLLVAVLGLLVNLISMKLLQAGAGESLNMKGAYLEVWSDMLGSLGVIAGAVLIRFTGWTVVDPIIAVLIGLWVLPRTWTLLREAGHVLMQGVPSGLDLDEIRDAMQAQPGVAAVHDLHAWVLTSGVNALSVHVVLADGAQHDDVLARAHAYVTGKHAVQHATIQVERGDFAKHETHL